MGPEFSVGDRVRLIADMHIDCGELLVVKGQVGGVTECDPSREYPYRVEFDCGESARVDAWEIERVNE